MEGAQAVHIHADQKLLVVIAGKWLWSQIRVFWIIAFIWKSAIKFQILIPYPFFYFVTYYRKVCTIWLFFNIFLFLKNSS